jgi:uncharacterized membrane protein YkoI
MVVVRALPYLMVIAALAATWTVSAQPYPSAPVQARVNSDTVSMDQAVKMAEHRFKARVVRAESQVSDGRTVYVLRLLNDSGRVWTVRVDASNGMVL